jgi:hypothetical protein
MNSVTDLLAHPISDIRHLAQSPAKRSVSGDSRADQDAAKVGCHNIG